MLKRKLIILVLGFMVPIILTSVAVYVYASDTIRLIIDGNEIKSDVVPVIENNRVLVPIRWVSNAMGVEVFWDEDNRQVILNSSSSKQKEIEEDTDNAINEKVNIELVKKWIKEQGAEEESSYFFDGLSFDVVNLDVDDDLEIFATIDGAVHLGQFFIFDKKDGKYKLIVEKPQKIEKVNLLPSMNLDGKKFFTLIERTGGTGLDIYYEHIAYLEDRKLKIAWTGVQKERDANLNHYNLRIGNYQYNPENQLLYTWESSFEHDIKTMDILENRGTITKVYQFVDDKFVEVQGGSANSITSEIDTKIKPPILKMKLMVNYGMEAELLIDEITEEKFNYRYFDFQHQDKPSNKQEEMAINEMFEMVVEDGHSFPKYTIHFYVHMVEQDVEVKVPNGFIDKFKNDLEFRSKVISKINQPFDNKDIAKFIDDKLFTR